MDVPNFIEIYENVLDENTCNLIINEFDQMWKNSAKIINKPSNNHEIPVIEHADVGYRTDQSLFAENYSPEAYMAVNKALEVGLKKYAEKYAAIKQYKGLLNQTVKIQRTPIRGGFHSWHFEQIPKENGQRALVWTLYLNTLPEGDGESEYLYQGIKVRPEAGKLVIWPTTFTHLHRGNPPYTCTKYIATGWFLVQD